MNIIGNGEQNLLEHDRSTNVDEKSNDVKKKKLLKRAQANY
jgi:hypothetical protein